MSLTLPLHADLENSTRPGAEFIPQPNLWVMLRQPVSPYSADEALLLCEVEGDRWVAWVPDHGEITLDRQQFYSASVN